MERRAHSLAVRASPAQIHLVSLDEHLHVTDASRRSLDRIELGALGFIVCLGSLLYWLCQSYPARLPMWLPWEFSWPEYLAAATGIWWYSRGLARTPAAKRPSLQRSLFYVSGIAVTYAVLQTRFLYLAEHMFFLHRVQHLVMHHLGPFLIALSWPGETLLKGMPGCIEAVCQARFVRRCCATIQRPVIAAVLFAGLVLLWLYPPLHFRAMIDRRLFAVMNWSMIIDGIFFFCLLFDPRAVVPPNLSIAARIVLAMSVQLPQVAVGALLMTAASDLYPWYDLCGRVFPSIDASADQQLGGMVILFPGGMMSALAALILLGRLWRAEEDAVASTATSL